MLEQRYTRNWSLQKSTNMCQFSVQNQPLKIWTLDNIMAYNDYANITVNMSIAWTTLSLMVVWHFSLHNEFHYELLCLKALYRKMLN